MADKTQLILVASATANTGTKTLLSLVERGHTNIRAMVKKLDDPRLECMKLPGVNFVQGDFDDMSTINAALSGVSRALLVTGAFDHLQFERETNFIQAARKAGCEAIVRISTASGLIKPGTKGAYGRAHHGIENFSTVGKFPVVHLNPVSSILSISTPNFGTSEIRFIFPFLLISFLELVYDEFPW